MKIEALSLFLLSLPASTAETPPCKSASPGSIDLIGLTTRVFHNERYLRVWLPPGYSDPANAAKRYPALYMMDGQTIFDGCAEPGDGSSWKINDTCHA